MRRQIVVLGCVGLGLALAASASAQQTPTPQERVAALKASLAANQKALRQYEWIETTIVRYEGEEKSRQQKKCYYGADGALQKVPLTEPAPQEKKRGLRGRIAAHKKEEMTDYMKSAVALVKSYVPPDSARIEAVKNAGKLSLTPMPEGGMWLAFADYLKPGDRLAVDLDAKASRLLGMRVSSYLDTPEDPVTLNAQMGTFTDGVTFYTKDITLDAPQKKIQVEVQNSGYRRVQ